ncbi:MAG: VWA domain-containing protein [Acidobacteria bacterium]|nr:MAG: VWA domain-containing protein [Acidobacteriota bacterium]
MALAVCSSVAAAQTSNVSQGQKNVQGATSSPNENEDVLLPPEGVSPDKVQPSTVPAASAETPEPTVGPAQSPVNQPSNTVTLTPQPQAGREPEKNKSGIFVFRTEVQEVTLHATVVDNHQRPVTTLDRSAFHVLEDGKPQRITSFRREDIPVALGIVIDNSGSMRDKRPSVNAAALNLVKASNPQDQVFVVNFNDEYYLDQDYTGNVSLLQDALERVEARGGTALYDAVVASSGHLLKSAKLQKKIILVVTDGEDTASRETLEKAVRTVAVDGGPTIYTIGLLAHERGEKRARRALQILAEQTGGVAFFPGNVNEVEAISQQIAHDIRNQYTIGYKPSSPKVEGAYRQVKVDASASGFKKLTVRTRSGYYATGGRAATASSKPDTKQGKPAGRSN